MNDEERKFFVEGFWYDKRGNIIIRFPKHTNNTVPRNETNEHILIDKMEEQVKGSEKFMKKLKHTIRGAKILTVLFGILLGYLINSISKLTGEEIIKDIILKLSAVLTSGCTCLCFTRYVNARILLNDLRKNKRFLAIKDTLNSKVRTNSSVLSNTSSKTKTMVAKTPEEREVFNINSFNNVPYKDLMKIMENIERSEKFGFDYDNVEVPSKPKTRKRVR